MIQSQLIYCGDNLQKLQDLPDECIDLIYIDPPFNSNRNYEVFWGDTKELRSFDDRFGAVEHYIHWMRPRVMQLYRVLKKTGSFYYHCDWHADAYIRVMLDQIFGMNGFRNAIHWKRSSAHSDAKQGRAQYGNITDTIFFYARGEATFNTQYTPYNEAYVSGFYKFVEEGTGRRYRLDNLTGPGGAGKGNPEYEVMGVTRHWRYSKENMERLIAEGRIIQTKPGTVPAYKRYLDEMPGVALQNLWDDIPPISAQAKERLGYPTQKPLQLLERIISVSSNKGDIVLDAFCGCGTALVSAQRLGRRWIGMDISPTSCRVMAKRLVKDCVLREGTDFWVRDLPKTPEELRKYPPFEFENWAVNALNTVIPNGQAIANRAQVGDMGIDGRIYPASTVREKQEGYDLFGESDRWFPVQVKQKDKAGRPDIDSFETAMQRQRRDKGFFVSFDFTRDAHQEISRASREMNLEIIPVTVHEILDEEVRYRL